MAGKAEIRKRLLEARRAMAPEDVAAKSEAVVHRLRTIDSFREAATILSYVSSKDNEVDTHALIESLVSEGKTVLVPVAERNRQLTWCRIESLAELASSRFGILEPRPESRRAAAPPFDSVALAPGIAFTTNGYRIGYGGGYYDRFLAEYPGLAIGLAFDLQMTGPFEVEPHDVPVDIVVTESIIYRPAQ